MSWDASLHAMVDGKTVPIPDADWNYTHNCNRMMATVLEESGHELSTPWFSHLGKAWWDALDGKTGAEGAAILSLIIVGMEQTPDRFIAMEPDNGWGSYKSVLELLKKMRDRSLEYPSAVWSVSG